MIHLKLENSGNVSLEELPCKDVGGDLYDLNEGFFKPHQRDVTSCSISKDEWEKCSHEIDEWLETTPDVIVNSIFTTPRRSPLAPPARRVLSQGLGSARRKVLKDIPEELNY